MTMPAAVTTRITLLVVTVIILSLISCNKEKSEAGLSRNMDGLDAFLRTKTFNYDSLQTYLADIQGDFVHAERKSKGYDAWNTTVDYKWNADSTVTFVHAYKTYPIGFSRERIIHSGDSILLVHRFSTEPLGLENRTDFTFLESVLYLAPEGTIKHLARISYREQHLKDTIGFRKKPFTDLTDDISHYYSLELNYSQHLMSD